MRANGHPVTLQTTATTSHRRPAFVSFTSDPADETPMFEKDRDRGRARRDNRERDRKRFDPRDRDDDWN